MITADTIQTYIFEPNYYKNDEIAIYWNVLKIFNNNILYFYIDIYYNSFFKIKQIKDNYIVSFFLDIYENKISFTKIKTYDNTKIELNDIIYNNDNYNFYNYDLNFNDNKIIKKIDKDIYIKYYHIKYIINDVSMKAIRYHEVCNSKYTYLKKYITYYINYYIIIYNDIKNNKARKCNNTIFCNYSRNFMLFI